MKPFRFWVQTALPLVYDDSLSYYELLCKVIDYINNFITTENQFAETIEEYTAKVDQIQQYVDGYFESSDFQQLVDDALDQMAEDGDFDTIITTILEAYEQQIDGTITGIQGDISGLQDDVSGLDGRLDTAEGSISDNTAAIDDLDDKIDNEIDGVNDRIDEEVATLNEKIGSGGAVWELVVVGGSNLGTCFFMYHGNECILFDTGSDATGTALISALTSRNINKFKAIVVSHWHSDHIGGLAPVLNYAGFDFDGCVMYKPHKNLDYSRIGGASWGSYIPGRDSDATTLILSKGGTDVYPEEGNEFDIDNVKLVFNNLDGNKFLNYYNSYIDENNVNTGECQYNNFCMITSVYVGNNKCVFPADILEASEAQNRNVVVGANLFMIEHHGLNLESDNSYLAGLNPDISIVTNYGSYYSLAQKCGYPTVNKCFANGNLLDNATTTIELSIGAYGITSYNGNRGIAKPNYSGALSVGSELVSGTDLNNLVEPGVYSIRNYDTLGNILHAPDLSTGGGKLLVMCDTTSGAMTQVFVSANTVTPMVALRTLAVGESAGWKAWKYLRPSYYKNESLGSYVSSKFELGGSSYQNRVFMQNGCITLSFYLTATDDVSPGTVFFEIPVALASGYYTPFVILDSSKNIYRGVAGVYDNKIEVWSNDAITNGTVVSGSVTFTFATDYPV